MGAYEITWEVNGQGLSRRIQGGGYGNEYQVRLPWSSTYKTDEIGDLGLFVRLNDSTLVNDGLESIILRINGEVIVEKTKWIEAASTTPGMVLPDDTGLWSYIEGSDWKSYSALPPASYNGD
ncbi:hypothetical protein [Muriicola soli]|uniref:Uncharacterized protein n=1 Tax=Muriicola soli TaxID=2507538 RepID=A0A411ECP2_9FLAO|nr:hypothetical protein [Muriicola soli]QBA65334.1 hypothetical protein EQY75_12815 [Muriicola soli]